MSVREAAAPAVAVAVLAAYLLWSGLVLAPGPHDNDWPLLMWLAKHASWSDPSPLFIGHYGFLQLVLVWSLAPWLGGTVAAAKLLNVLATGGCLVLLWALARRLGGAAAGWLALAFAATVPALLGGQSEFGDPLATFAWLGGLGLALRGGPVASLLGGLALGVAGLVRIHFALYSLVTLALLAAFSPWPAEPARARVARLAAIAAGLLLGIAPSVALNLALHGTLLSPVSSYLVGQVVCGFDEFDFLATHARCPIQMLLREQPWALVGLAVTRTAEQPHLWLLPVAAAAVILARVRDPVRRRAVLCACALALAYFGAFVALAYRSTPRLLFPLDVLLVLVGAVATASLLPAGRPRLAPALLAVAVVALLVTSARPVALRVQETRHRWERSAELVALLRSQGMRDAREAFVFDWNRFVTDDPELQPYYGFGFWNLLLPRYREERPIPTATLGDRAAFTSFLRDQDVRFVVLSRRIGRFPVLLPVLAGTAGLPGYRRLVDLPEDVVFVRSPR